MSLRKDIFVQCDLCGFIEMDEAGWANSFSYAGTARFYAREHGWRRRKIEGKWSDICYNCLEKEKEETK